MHPLETYLAEIATLRGATKETSGYWLLLNWADKSQRCSTRKRKFKV